MVMNDMTWLAQMHVILNDAFLPQSPTLESFPHILEKEMACITLLL